MTTQTATRERPILFSSEMIRAILTGRKCQTRRVVKPQPHQPSIKWGDVEESEKYPGEFFQWCDGGDRGPSFTCPHGQPGDRLWVRERFRIEQGDVCYFTECPTCKLSGHDGEAGWKSPIFMPRWASRITLEITSVTVERLQEISYRDCIAEGMPPVPCYDDGAEPETILRAIRDKYRTLWDSINSKRATWDSDPFVWVISFKRIKP